MNILKLIRHRNVIHVVLALLTILVFVWFYIYNRFQILFYQEQMQLFRFDTFYFNMCINQPGGLIDYAGSFLTQFFYYHWLGALVYTSVVIVLAWFFYKICARSGHIERLFFVPVVPAMLLLLSSLSQRFLLAHALGLLCVCSGFLVYICLKSPQRYVWGVLLFTFVYFIAGGNALVLSALMLLCELFAQKQSYKHLFIGILWTLSIIVPYVAWQWVYVIPLKTAYFAMTASVLPFPNLAIKMLWWSIPLLYCLWRLVAPVIDLKGEKWKIPAIVSETLLIGMLIYVVYIYDSRSEKVNQISYEAQHENWEKVLQLSSQYPGSSRLVTYFMNIALSESGKMPDQMFHYKQYGPAGLFLDRDFGSVTSMFLGEIYYKLGMMPIAEQCAFESMIVWSQKTNAQTLQRLINTNMLRRDSLTCCKYIRQLDHSLFYKKWAKQKRDYLQHVMNDPSFEPPHVPVLHAYKNYFINYGYPDRTLLILLEGDPHHQMAFEYLMAYYLLGKDIESAKVLMDMYYANFNYPSMPASYEEALLVYEYTMQEQFSYPINPSTRQRFSEYIQTIQRSLNREHLEKQYGNTYWFYAHFVQPVFLQRTEDPSRY